MFQNEKYGKMLPGSQFFIGLTVGPFQKTGSGAKQNSA
jgi:hypothetical protein